MLHLFSLSTTFGAVIPNVVLVLFLLFRFRADNSNGAKELQIESTSVAIFKGGPESLEKEIHKILGSKREDRFCDPFLKLVQKNSDSPVCGSCHRCAVLSFDFPSYRPCHQCAVL